VSARRVREKGVIMERVALCLLLVSVLAIASLPVTAQLIKSWERLQTDAVTDGVVAVDQQGNVYTASPEPITDTQELYTTPYGDQMPAIQPPTEVVVTKYDPNGSVVWRTAQRPDGYEPSWVEPTVMAIDALGNVYVAGCTDDVAVFSGGQLWYLPAASNYFVVKFNPNGDVDEAWQDFVPGCVSHLGIQWDVYPGSWLPVAVVSGPGGSVFVAGISWANGEHVWPGPYFDPNYGNALDCVESIVYSGLATPYVAKYSPTGQREWLWPPSVWQEDPPVPQIWSLGAVVPEADGGVRLVGGEQGDGPLTTLRLDANGSELWRTSDSVGMGSHFRIATDQQGNVVAAAETSESATGRAIIKYDSSGNRIWLRQFGFEGVDPEWCEPLLVNVDQAGNTIVTARLWIWWSPDWDNGGFVKYDAGGNLLWSTTFYPIDEDDSLCHYPLSLGLDGAGNVYVDVETYPGSNWDWWSDEIRKYSSDGTLLWTTDTGDRWSDKIVPAGAGSVYTLDEWWDDTTGWVVALAKWANVPGQDIVVEAAPGVVLTFANMTEPGGTTATTSPTGPTPPAGFRLGSPAIHYDITTEAVFSGQIQIALDYSGVSYHSEKALHLFHYENGAWVNVTTSVDTVNKIIYGTVSSLSPFVIAEADVVRVTVDIKPGSYPNTINLGSNGTVPVAILSTADFDAAKVDPLTVTLASAPVKLKGKGTPMFSIEDVNGDGRPDMVAHVSTQALVLNPNDSEAVLEGWTTDGIPIHGSDTVRVVP
jgi:hypothetical protein